MYVLLLSLLFIDFHLLVDQAATALTPQSHHEFQKKILKTQITIHSFTSWLHSFAFCSFSPSSSPFHHHNHLIIPVVIFVSLLLTDVLVYR
ncbi:hypothetical protein BZA77DRAFT_62583 [Pyronema omphalodes]|nr:hypothetical protein BZA77DRAFT_62583 [Pyronema omphalodes]